ncbi:MAG: peptidoglycan-binding domain-containing protein [Proteobacteria bacterium]|nr:peptidoglycan-binding domain-containing protein [Pseudomonadota bacterium]MDA1023950.1 peptidoglycan-binding domain-containing protein [Pseudomonadota bacterium]
MPSNLFISAKKVSLVRCLAFVACVHALAYSPQVSAARPTGDIPALEEPRSSKSDNLVLRIQKALSKLGVYKGPVDGRMGPQTQSAIKVYQRSSGLTINGRVTEQLVQGLENALQVNILIKRLDNVRIENMSAARKTLLSHPATRDLIAGPVDEVADPTRDPKQCLENVTVRCLLNEALESSKAIFKAELRDWALGEILVAQARAGLGKAAMETAARIKDPRLIVVALRDIAEAQAASGLGRKALAAAEIIPDPQKQAEALAAIANIQVNRGDGISAHETAERLLRALGKVENPLTRISLKTRAAVILAKAGDGPTAQDILTETEAFARQNIEGIERGVALRHVANALAETEQMARAMTVLSDVREDSNRTPVLITAATQQALAGDAAAALATADTIEAVRYRAVVLGRIALTQAEAGNVDEADLTLEMALAAIAKIKLPYALSYAVSRVSLSMAGIGKAPKAQSRALAIFEKAVQTAARIDDNRLRAHTLWNIAAEQVRGGFPEQAEATREKAEKATSEIKSALSRVWMFSEIANVHATEGEEAAAWAAFDHGHRVAQELDNPWGRARAFGKLAATLINLVDPGKISP